MARRHLAIFLKGVADKIISGEKEVEIRLSQKRISPYGQVAKDDEILLKNAGGKIIGKVKVDNCLYYEKLTPESVEEIKQKYHQAARMEESFWQNKNQAHFATIIFLKNPQKFLSPINYKKTDRRPWLVIDEHL